MPTDLSAQDLPEPEPQTSAGPAAEPEMELDPELDFAGFDDPDKQDRLWLRALTEMLGMLSETYENVGHGKSRAHLDNLMYHASARAVRILRRDVVEGLAEDSDIYSEDHD